MLCKRDIAKHLIDKKLFHTQLAANDFVEAMFEEISYTLSKGEEVRIHGFGNFKLITKDERIGRNPRTGEIYPIKARRVTTFKMNPKLKSRVQS